MSTTKEHEMHFDREAARLESLADLWADTHPSEPIEVETGGITAVVDPRPADRRAWATVTANGRTTALASSDLDSAFEMWEDNDGDPMSLDANTWALWVARQVFPI